MFNYTRDVPFIWEEMALPITYTADRGRAEAILLEVAKLHAMDPNSVAADSMGHLQSRFGVDPIDLVPKVYWRITDNWLELTVHFVLGTHQIQAPRTP